MFRSATTGIAIFRLEQYSQNNNFKDVIKRMALTWRVKIAIKLILRKIPYRIKNKCFGSFMYRLGKMKVSAYVYAVCERQYEYVSQYIDIKGKTILEIGPGDSVASAIFYYGLGCKKIILLDNGNYAIKDISIYNTIIDELLKNKKYRSLCDKDIIELKKAKTFESLLTQINAVYLCGGMEELKTLEDGSVSFIYSNAVLEHIYKEEVPVFIDEFNRILCDDGGTFHMIDYKDHLDMNLHSLEFSERVWESTSFRTAGFYTNRYRHNDLVNMFEIAGFIKCFEENWYFDPDIINIEKLHSDYRGREDLLISESILLFQKRSK